MADIVVETLGPLFSLAEVKQHLNVDFVDDDVIIQAYMDAAEVAVLQYCNISLVPVGAEAVFKAAALIVVAEFYQNRDSDCAGLPRASQLLINPYRWLRV